ncbi:class I SAM-dependent methyltransferase [Aurantiacibacter aquimixticola]|uniref:Class I SAM-dependent methyltransferase n=1 Tax=Aurantiacibacter aquimixticola TaxID=1958945 RepID=A0A419RW62_9SPHN|nr:class I SAM-dependent methyltransferase [Aurantiacibacter aquimixticola]RJY10019.1 class I SAM-dependent methyltransferase [Aurantiacibacter aquimixticola]
MASDLPPPYTALTRHPMMPHTSHDEAARFNFLTHFNRFLSGPLGSGNKLAYEKRALPAFREQHGRDPEHRYEIREAMNRDNWHRMWSAMKRNSMEMRQHNGRQVVLRQLEELGEKAGQLIEMAGNLELDQSVEQPHYQTAVDIHCQPGGYHSEELPGDVSAGANYDVGIFATTGGALGGLNDGGGQAVVEWLRRERPDWQPRRVLDIGATVGHNAVPIAQAFPDAEVIAIDTAGASLRYGAARAAAMGIDNIRFVQASGEDLSRWADEHFDWVQTTMFLHELSSKAMPRLLKEAHRVLAPGGLIFHIEQPQYSDEMPLYEQFMRDWDAFNNNEPFWSAMHALDLKQVMEGAGFPRDCQFTAGVRAVVDPEIFPPSPDEGEEDFGRAAIWNAYGAWKPNLGEQARAA